MHFTLQTGPRNQSAACQPNIALLAPASRSLQACLPQAHMKRSSVRAVKLSAVLDCRHQVPCACHALPHPASCLAMQGSL